MGSYSTSTERGLPLDRGGGGFSWGILSNDRIGINSVHQVTADYDRGSVLAYAEYLFWRRLSVAYRLLPGVGKKM